MLAIEIKRFLRDPGLIFVLGIPVLMYLIFGAAQSYGESPMAHGNVAMAIMVGMAAYGAASATVSLASSSGVELLQGWGRQIALTPLTPRRYALLKSAAATIFAAITAAIIYAVAAPTGAHGTWKAWLLSFVIVVLGSLPFALYGLAMAYLFRSSAATSVATGLLVLFGFAGNLFIPLSGTLLTISRFTPMWGYITLARWPIAEGYWVTSEGKEYTDQLWQAALSLGVWTLIIAGLAAFAMRRRGVGVKIESVPTQGTTPEVAPMMPVPEDVSSRKEYRRERIGQAVGILMSTVWLGFLVFPVSAILAAPVGTAQKVLFLGVLAAFVGAYVWGMVVANTRPEPFSDTLYPTSVTLVVVCAVLTVVALWLSPSGVALSVYLVALVMISLPPRIAYVLGGALVLVLIAATWSPMGDGFWAFALIAAGVYVSALGSSYYSRRADREKAAARREAVVSERERVARDVHDVLGHTLTVISLKSELAAKLLDAAPERARAEVLEINELSRQAIADVRATVSGLSGRQLATEIAAIRELAGELPIELTIVGEPDDADPRHRILFGWVAREAFTNVVRHAHARRVTITIEPHRLAVSDDGVGFGGVEGNGLRGLRTRVEEAGGTLAITGGPGGGTTIEVRA